MKTLVLLLAFATAVRADTISPRLLRCTTTVESGDHGGTYFGARPDPAHTRHYYIAAETDLWDFAPRGRDEVCGLPIPAATSANLRREKYRYFQYTDATFTARVLPNPALGLFGPVLRGVVGDFIAVTFLNRTPRPLSMHPHGVSYDKDSEGAYYQPDPGRGAAVAPSARFTYVWKLDESAGPSPDEPSSKAWLYHSHVTGDAEINLGLAGSIIVTDPRRARADGTPADVDREFAALFMIFDESGLDDEADEGPAPVLAWAETQRLIALGARKAINGYIYGNLPGLEVNEGEHVRWYLFGLGSEQDMHTAHWHGFRVQEGGRRRTDVVELLPATMKVADMVADNPGSWLFHCHVAEHMRDGMFARLTVFPRDAVGVDRAPAAAFLGLPQAARSLRIDRVANHGTRVIVEGVATTLLEGVDVSQEPIHVQLGDRAVTFHADQRGVARAAGAELRVKNGNELGFVRGGLVEFELAFERDPRTGPGRPLPLVMEFEQLRHTATVALP